MKKSRTAVHPILAEARDLAAKLIAWRRHLHAHPEPSRGEEKTAAYVVRELRALGLTSIRTGVGGHGVVALVGRPARLSACGHAQARGRVAALRADMDALELTETTGAPYASEVPGLAHACGHDGHVACLLGAAAILKRREADLPGAVKLLFQPAEESGAGARSMIEDGCLADPEVHAVAGLHFFSDLKSGVVGIRRGAYTAQSDAVRIVVHGRSGHAARPHAAVDAVAVAAHLITAIHAFLDRRIDPVEPRVFTVGRIAGGTRLNIIADRVTLDGTLRTLNPRVRARIARFLRTDLAGQARGFGARVEVEIGDGYPPLINDDRVVDALERAARGLFPARQVREVRRPSMGGEDFAFYATLGKVPAAMCRLGIRDVKKGFTAPLHNSAFDFDDAAVLPVGAALLAQTAVEILTRR